MDQQATPTQQVSPDQAVQQSQPAPESPSSPESSQQAESTASTAAKAKQEPNVKELIRGSYRAMEQAAKIRKEYETRRSQLEADPIASIKANPEAWKKVYDSIVFELAERKYMEEMDENTRNLYLRDKVVQEKEAQMAEKEAVASQDYLERATTYHQNEYAREFMGIADRHNLPIAPETFERLCEGVLIGMENGFTPTEDQLVEYVREFYETKPRNYFSSYEGDALLDVLGEELVAKVQAAALAR
ncbi:MAG: hypothetical protein MN733_38190 [Nitrososphaera sp.]|nr:hypothetical protein [Nitrososphaera sp.]